MLCVLNRLSSRLQRWLCAWPQGRAGHSEPSDASARSRTQSSPGVAAVLVLSGCLFLFFECR